MWTRIKLLIASSRYTKSNQTKSCNFISLSLLSGIQIISNLMDRDYFPVELRDKEQMKRYRLIGKYAMYRYHRRHSIRKIIAGWV